MKYFLLYVIICAAACTPVAKPADGGAAISELLSTDKAFSERSVAVGMNKAYIEYLDSNGVLLRPQQMPLLSADAVDYLIQQNDKDFTLSWKPEKAVVASSGDLGYTYGYYAVQPSLADTSLYGTYISIWKKQYDGSWKLVLNSGNNDIGSGN